MKESVLKQRLKEILPTARTAFIGKQELPYIVYLTDGRTKQICADDAVAARIVPWRIELYSRRAMPEAAAAIEDVLDGLEVIYSTESAYLEEEHVLITYFFFEALRED